MVRSILLSSLLGGLAAGLAAQQSPTSRPTRPDAQRAPDDFKREGSPAQRKLKDALEGKTPPELVVEKWMNIEGKGLTFDALKGKVVAIKFWGVW